MDDLPYEVIPVDGSRSERNRENRLDLPAAYVFKIGLDGEMHEIEAVGFRAPCTRRPAGSKSLSSGFGRPAAELDGLAVHREAQNVAAVLAVVARPVHEHDLVARL